MTGYQVEFAQRVRDLDEAALLAIVDRPADYTPDALAAAQAEIDRRGGIEQVRALVQSDDETAPASGAKRNPIRNTFSRSGRFTRGEFARVALPAVGLNLMATYFGPRLLVRTYGTEDDRMLPLGLLLIGLLLMLLGILSIVILVGAATQRLRDIGRSGWWALVVLVPYLKYALLLGLFIVPSGQRAAKR